MKTKTPTSRKAIDASQALPWARGGYVKLDRRLRPIADEPSTGWSRRMLGKSGGAGWEALVPLQPGPASRGRGASVVVAPSGMGKTEELRAHSQRLLATGIASFFVTAAELIGAGMAQACRDAARLAAWRLTTHRAIFFIDAVDELRLEGSNLTRVLLRFEQDVDPGTRPDLHVVISSRNEVWSQDDARELVRGLALPSEEPPVSVVALEPLHLEDIETYVNALDSANTKAFMDAFVEEELDQLLDVRPPDVGLLLDYWRSHRAFGTWSQMLDASTDASLREDTRARSDLQRLAPAAARHALKRVAAACVLSKKPLVSLPSTPTPAEVDAAELFSDHPRGATSQLLSMGLFVQKGTHSVQLPQGATSCRLAAKWLADRATAGWPLGELEDALLVRPFGIDRTLVPSSRAAVLGWVASEVPGLRPRLLAELPHVLLFEGDPGRLERAEVVKALQAVVGDMKRGRGEMMPTIGTLRQVAKHNISTEVRSLLKGSVGFPKIQRMLLRLAEVGRYTAMVPDALAVALSGETKDIAVAAAIRVIAASGSVAQRRRLLRLTAHPSPDVRTALVEALVPETLNGQALVDLVVQVSGLERTYLLGRALKRAALSDIDAILDALSPPLAASDVNDDATRDRVNVAARLVVTRLQRSGSNVPRSVVSALRTVESLLGGPIFVASDVQDELEEQLRTNADLRRELWRERVAAAKDPMGLSRLMRPALGRADAPDFEWLWALREDASDAQVKNVLLWELQGSWSRMPGVEREAKRQSSMTPGLAAVIDEYEKEERAQADRTDERAAKDAEKEANVRANNITELERLRGPIEAGEAPNALIWAWQHLTDTESRRARLGTGELVKSVGPDLAEVFLTGMQRWWRRCGPLPRRPGDNTLSLEVLAGLTGLSLEISRGLDVSKLADDDVELATRYALHEMNGLPLWFDDLRHAHPDRVKATLAGIIDIEWASPVLHHGLISRAPYEPEGTAQLVRDLVLEKLEGGAPGHQRTVHDAISALLVPSAPPRDPAPILRQYVDRVASAEAGLTATWLRGWAHFAPLPAAKWLGSLAKTNRGRFTEVLQQLAAAIEEDFDERIRPLPLTWQPSALEAWVRLLHMAVRPEDDVTHPSGRMHVVGQRDQAQAFRARCITALARNPSREAFDALRRIRDASEMKPYLSFVDRAMDEQLARAAEDLAKPWTETKIVAVERGDEHAPVSVGELFALVQRHLRRVALLLENHDFSYARLFAVDTHEREVQCWVASCLELMSRGLYTVSREPAVQHGKLMDLSVTVPSVGRVPIEVKPLYVTRYAYRRLEYFISNQLVGRYMAPPTATHGVFLLVPLVAGRKWQVGGDSLLFDDVFRKLTAYANAVGKKTGKEVAVVAINVAAARGVQRRKAKPRSARAKASAGSGSRNKKVKGAKPAHATKKSRQRPSMDGNGGRRSRERG